jgi:uncharacterized protein
MSAYLLATAAGVFVGYLTAYRVLMTWVYRRTESTLLGMVMHASFTTSLLVLNPPGISGRNLFVYSFSLAAALWVVVAIVGFAIRRGRVERPSRTASRAL